MNGEQYNVTGAGQGNYNTVGAGTGIASFLGLNAGNILGGNGFGCNRGINAPVEVITSEDKPKSGRWRIATDTPHLHCYPC